MKEVKKLTSTVLISSMAGVLDNIIATLLIAIYEFLYKPDGMIGIFSQYNEIIDNILAQDNFIADTFKALKLIGIALLVTSCLVSLMDKVSTGDFSINNVFRHLLKYVILYMVLMNANAILEYLLDISTSTFSDLKVYTDEITANSAAMTFEHAIMANSVYKHMGFGTKLGAFIMLMIPYAISVIFTIVLNFFAVSRLIEITVRVSVSPVVAGLSFFGDGANLDFVRYAKRTLGLFFQIIVILIICVSVTFVHNELITTDEGGATEVNTIEDPAVRLVGSYDTEYNEIEERTMKTEKKTNAVGDVEATSTEVSREWKKAEKDTSKVPTLNYQQEITDVAYKKSDFTYFYQHLVDPSTFFISTGIMISALFLIFKSREISTKLFA